MSDLEVLAHCVVTFPISLEDYQVMSYELQQWCPPGSAVIFSTPGFLKLISQAILKKHKIEKS